MMKILIAHIGLLFAVSYGADVTNVVPGIYSKKVVSNGPCLLVATGIFSPPLLLINHMQSSSTISLCFVLQIKISLAS